MNLKEIFRSHLFGKIKKTTRNNIFLGEKGKYYAI